MGNETSYFSAGFYSRDKIGIINGWYECCDVYIYAVLKSGTQCVKVVRAVPCSVTCTHVLACEGSKFLLMFIPEMTLLKNHPNIKNIINREFTLTDPLTPTENGKHCHPIQVTNTQLVTRIDCVLNYNTEYWRPPFDNTYEDIHCLDTAVAKRHAEEYMDVVIKQSKILLNSLEENERERMKQMDYENAQKFNLKSVIEKYENILVDETQEKKEELP